MGELNLDSEEKQAIEESRQHILGKPLFRPTAEEYSQLTIEQIVRLNREYEIAGEELDIPDPRAGKAEELRLKKEQALGKLLGSTGSDEFGMKQFGKILDAEKHSEDDSFGGANY